MSRAIPPARGEGGVFYAPLRLLVRAFLRLVFGFRVEGAQHIPPQGGLIAVANHASFIDPVILAAALPRRPYYLMNEEYYDRPPLTWVYRAFAAIPIGSRARTLRGVRRGIRLLAQGRVVGIFPEGGRSPDGRVHEGRVGVAYLAARCGCPVCPVAILGTYQVLPRGARWFRRHPLLVKIGPPLEFGPPVDRHPSRIWLEETLAGIMQEITRLWQEGERTLSSWPSP